MTEGILKAIRELTEEIYTIEQSGLIEKFNAFLESTAAFIDAMSQAGYEVDMNKELLRIQEAFAKKDYVRLADVLLYDLKPELEGIEV